MRSVFQRLLLDPGNPALNLRYAELSAERGEIARAMAAYERVLADDPANATARRELERLRLLFEPPSTEIVFSLGLQFESNAPRQDPSFRAYNDLNANAMLALRDERVLGDHRWRSFGAAFMNVHNRYRSGDLGYVGANTGPVLALPNGWTLRPAAGAAFASRDYGTMFVEGSLIANIETVGAGPLEEIDARVAAQDWTGRDPGHDAIIAELGATFRWRDVTGSDDVFAFSPVYTYNAASSADNRYRSAGLAFDYLVPLASVAPGAPPLVRGSAIGLELRAEWSKYDAPDRRIALPDRDRRDIYVAPGIRLVVPSLLGTNETWTLRYVFEDNVSNEFINKYRDHAVGLTASWRL